MFILKKHPKTIMNYIYLEIYPNPLIIVLNVLFNTNNSTIYVLISKRVFGNPISDAAV